MADHKNILVEEDGGITRIVLNRPEKLNALSAETYGELLSVLGEIDQNPACRVLVVTGAGRAFCSGADIGELLEATATMDSIRKRLRFTHSLSACLRKLSQPVIMAVNGDAFGGGCSLALNGDIRIASDNARFGFTFNRVGLALDLGSVYNLVQLAGPSKALELYSLAAVLSAQEAKDIGLVNKVVAPDQLESTVREWASKIASGAQLPMRLMKPAIYQAANLDFNSELENEINIQSLCMAGPDAKEGLSAFLEKRKPVFGSSPGGNRK
ncbi:MAG: enoyl-CoA hydratase/isomerase family protein [Chloroflexi bacterium]|nr:enoyl-CoA hydratase/isomerase family protein [Chloroflexota bacterium]